MTDWFAVQRRLHKLGFNPGPVDGIRGRMTINAVKRFQEASGLVPDGIVGPLTLGELFSSSPSVGIDSIPWFEEAKRLVGLAEDPRSGASNPDVVALAEIVDEIDYKSDDIPWCGLFVAHCISLSLPDEPIPNNPLGARNWGGFGVQCTPQIGSIMTFWRGKRTGWKGHVGFFAGEESGHFLVLGGNQGNAVNVARYPKERFLESRWPLTAMPAPGEPYGGVNGLAGMDLDVDMA